MELQAASRFAINTHPAIKTSFLSTFFTIISSTLGLTTTIRFTLHHNLRMQNSLSTERSSLNNNKVPQSLETPHSELAKRLKYQKTTHSFESGTIKMANNILSTENVLKHMADALPTHEKDDTNSDISSSYEAIALFAHACMVAVGFRLVGFGEEQKMEEECQRLAPRISAKWNSSFGSHSFLYAHSQSSMQYVVKVDRLGGKAEIRGIGLGDERISRFEITAKDYVSSAALPLRIPMTNGGEDRSTLEQKLKDVFISPSRIQGQSLYTVSSIIPSH